MQHTYIFHSKNVRTIKTNIFQVEYGNPISF